MPIDDRFTNASARSWEPVDHSLQKSPHRVRAGRACIDDERDSVAEAVPGIVQADQRGASEEVGMEVDQPRHDQVPVRFDARRVLHRDRAGFGDLSDHAIVDHQVARLVDAVAGVDEASAMDHHPHAQLLTDDTTRVGCDHSAGGHQMLTTSRRPCGTVPGTCRRTWRRRPRRPRSSRSVSPGFRSRFEQSPRPRRS